MASGGVLVVNADGRTDGATMIAGGSAYVFDGGLAEATIVESGGYEVVRSGGTADQTTVFGGSVMRVGDQSFVGGVAVDTRIFSVSILYVGNNGEASGTVISAGGTVSGFLDVQLVSTTISSGGVQTLQAEAESRFTTIDYGGTEIPGENSSSFAVTINSGGVQLVSRPDYSNDYEPTANNTVVSGGGLQRLTGAAQANDTVVEAGGAQLVSSGATASGTTISSGGYANVYSSGMAGSTMVAAGGEQYILDAGSATDTALYGTQLLFSGATASDTYVGDNAGQYVLGGGGTDFTTIASGGYEIVSSGGTANDTLIESGGMLDLAGLTYTGGGTITSGSVPKVMQAATRPEASIDTTTLTITEGDQTVTLQLAGDYAGEYFHLAPAPDGLNGTVLTVDDTPPCFAAGSRILTDLGEIAVEDLRTGDRLITRREGLATPAWIVRIGQRRVDIAAHPHPKLVRPIRFAPNALRQGSPSRSLLLSLDYGVLFEGLLIAARQLVNGGSIAVEQAATVRYFHLELDRHGILLAEGVEAESYLDTGNRHQFRNGGPALALHPDFSRNNHPDACAPLATDAGIVQPIWQRLAERSASLGHVCVTRPTTRDPDLQLLLPDGRALRPDPVRADGRYSFLLHRESRQGGMIRLRSRHAAAADLRPWEDDRRQLGVGVGGISFWTGRGGLTPISVALDDPAFVSGWWAPEADRTRTWRWTDGDARLDLSPECVRIDVLVTATATYPDERREGEARAST